MRHLSLYITLVVLGYSNSAAQPDSVLSTTPQYGCLSVVPSDTLLSITKQDRRAVQYHTLGELLIRGTVLQPLSQGGFGQYDAISVLGSQQTGLALSVNGRSYRSTWNDALNLSTIAPEGIEKIELLTGSSAIGLAPTLTQTAMNLQEVRYNTKTPYTALWYSQGGGEAIAADVALAQNVAPGLNVSAGVRRNGAQGRYAQTDYDVWNVRIAARYAMDTATTLGVSYNMTSHNTDLWGGIRTIDNYEQLTERTTPTVFDDVRDHERRHDVNVGVDHLLTPDSAHSISGTAYYSLDGLMRIRDTGLVQYTDDTSRYVEYHGQMAGILLRSKHLFKSTLLRLGVGAEYSTNDEAAYTETISEVQPRALVHVNHAVTTTASLQAAGQVAIVHHRLAYGVGAGGTWQTGVVHTRLDASYLVRPPTPAEGLDLNPEKVFLGFAECSVLNPSYQLTGQVFLRSTSDQITGIPIADDVQRVYGIASVNDTELNQLLGGVVSAHYQHPWFELNGALRFHNQLSGTAALPPVSGDLSVNAVYNVGRSTLRGGVRVSAVAPGRQLQFVPLTWQSVSSVSTEQHAMYNGLDLFLTAFVGNASVRVSYENVLAQQWHTTSVAPLIIRDLRLSVTWSFFD